ncbi:MAG TPA: membrane protein insertase YidC [Candidatus Avimonas sp.]|jgi:YidC/Oxa1 family membrane protein insertase|nr:membrane protein insertase YidC [Candidatus Avimonas sp.]
MELLNLLLGVPLGYLMYLCYRLTGGYGMSIIVFTVLTKIILFPLSLLSQKNSIKMVKIQPRLDDIRIRNEGNIELIMQEQRRLYKEEGYSTVIGILPLLLQIPLILGLINVIYNPLQHLLHVSPDVISLLADKTMELTGVADLGYGGQLTIMETVRKHPEAFLALPGVSEIVEQIKQADLMFLGINLSEVPKWASATVLVPLLSGASALILSLVQNSVNVLQKEQGAVGKWAMTIFLVVFSGYFAFVVPSGIGVYWIFGNLLSILVTYICNWVYNPRKYIDYENRPQKPKLTKEEREQIRLQKKLARKREREDYRRFFSQKKQLVFYSEASGFYKYFERLIDYIINNSDIVVHYVTSDYSDRIFNNEDLRIQKYYIGPKLLIPFMMKMDADMVVMTTPDLEKYHIKRSIVRKDVEYVYLDHGMSSFHLTLREGALDHFDTIFCYGPNHITEVRQTEEAYGLPPKKLVETGYGLLDTLLENVAKLPPVENEVKQILIAPSWQKDNILEYCLDEVLSQLLHKGFKVILRPHPEFVKRFSGKMKSIETKYQQDIGDDFIIETDFSSNSTVFMSDLVITDWSTIAHEFSYATKKPSLFINTPMKVMNPNYKRIAAVPLDISLRDQIGISVDTDKLDTLLDKVNYLLSKREEYRQKITDVMQENIFNIGSSAEKGGAYIIETLKEKKAQREKAERELEALLKGIDPSTLDTEYDDGKENKHPRVNAGTA